MRDQDEFGHASQMQSERNRGGEQPWTRDQSLQERQLGGRYPADTLPRTSGYGYGNQPSWEGERYAAEGTGPFYHQTQDDWRSENEWERGARSQGTGRGRGYSLPGGFEQGQYAGPQYGAPVYQQRYRRARGPSGYGQGALEVAAASGQSYGNLYPGYRQDVYGGENRPQYGQFGRYTESQQGRLYGGAAHGNPTGLDRQRSQGMYGTSMRGRGPKGYARSDERIKEDINEKLYDDQDVDASDITLEVRQGVVSLSGTVPARWMKYQAEDIADACAGVKDVQNQLRVARESPEQEWRAGDGADDLSGSDGKSRSSQRTQSSTSATGSQASKN